jgi:DNA-binding transcriptional ArsR family regulator
MRRILSKASAVKLRADRSAPRSRSEIHLKQAAAVFNIIGSPLRLKVLLILAGSPRDLIQLRADLGFVDPGLMRRHLEVLERGKLVRYRRHGIQRVYDLTEDGFMVARFYQTFTGSTVLLSPLPKYQESDIDTDNNRPDPQPPHPDVDAEDLETEYVRRSHEPV